MNTLRDCIKYGTTVLEQVNILNASGEAWYLLEHLLAIDKVYYLMHLEEAISEEKWDAYKQLLDRRASHYPLQYITGQQEFMGHTFIVNEHVLIPRQDTETLVEDIINQVKQPNSLLDMCTGSGCIAISLALALHPSVAVGVDISSEALLVAKENGKRLGGQVEFIESDLFANVTGTYDLIVSNPPYIATDICQTLMPEVREHEPMLALDGAEDGLFFYEKIIDQARDYLNEDGWLFFEIGYDQGDKIFAILEQYEEYSNIKLKQDLAGLNRIIQARYSRVSGG